MIFKILILLLQSTLAFSYAGGAYTVGNQDISHALMAENAVYLVLNSDKKEKAKQILLPNLLNIKIGSEMPDIDETYPILGIATNAGHFYDWKTGKNWLGKHHPTAKTEFYRHVYNSFYFNFVNEISRAIHYIEDSCEPHHATNKVPPFSYHVDFENYVRDLHWSNPEILKAYSFDKNIKIEEIIDRCSIKAGNYGIYFTDDPSSFNENNWKIIASSIVPFTESMVASFLYNIL